MTQRISHPKEAVVRVFSKDGRFVGTGCLEASGLIVTCAHVVRDALGLTKIGADSPAGEVGIDFPFLNEDGFRHRDEAPTQLPFFAEVAPGGWGPSDGVPPSNIPSCNDVAILRLIGSPPFRCSCLFPDLEPDGQDLPVYVHGFRDGGASPGEFVDGKIAPNSKRPDGLWSFDSKGSAYVVNPGFSGAPLFPVGGWHASSAVGMLIGDPKKGTGADEPLRDAKRVALIIPAKRIHALIKACLSG